MVYKAVGIKPKLPWRHEEVGDARNMECLQQKAACCWQNQLKRDVFLGDLVQLNDDMCLDIKLTKSEMW